MHNIQISMIPLYEQHVKNKVVTKAGSKIAGLGTSLTLYNKPSQQLIDDMQ